MAYIIICLFFGLAGGIIGKVKGSSFFLWYLIAAILPLLGLIAALAYRNEHDELRRACPGCNKVCMLYDAICVRCGHELDFPSVAISPKSQKGSDPLSPAT